MMPLDERIGWLLLGCAIGFILGYMVRMLRESKEEVHEIHAELGELVNKPLKKRDEAGFSRNPLVLDAVLIFVVLVTLWSVWKSLESSEEVRDAQNEIAEVTYCNQQYLKHQADYLSIFLQEPPASNNDRDKALRQYYKLLVAYAEDDKGRPDPTPGKPSLEDCLNLAGGLDD